MKRVCALLCHTSCGCSPPKTVVARRFSSFDSFCQKDGRGANEKVAKRQSTFCATVIDSATLPLVDADISSHPETGHNHGRTADAQTTNENQQTSPSQSSFARSIVEVVSTILRNNTILPTCQVPPQGHRQAFIIT